MIVRRVGAGVALLVAIVAVSVLVLSGGSTYTLHLIFSNASQLVNGNEVKVGGVPIGTVSNISLTPDGQAQVTVSISDGQFQPLHRGTTAAVRISSLSSVANRFIAINPGPNSEPRIPDSGVIGTTNTQPQVEIDTLQSALDADTRQSLQWLLHGGAQAYAGTGPALNRGILALDPALAQLQKMIGQISGDSAALDSFIINGAGVVSAVASHQRDLQGGLATAAQTAQAIASERAALDGVLAQAPGTLNHATATLGRTNATLAVVQPVAEQLLPVAPRLTRFLTRVSPVLHHAIPVLGQVQALLPDLRAALAELPALRSVALPAFSAATGAISSSAHIVAGALPYVPDIILGNTNGFAGTAGGYYDANGDYARIAVVGGPFSVAGLGTLVPVPPIGFTQHNTSRCPGAATQVAADRSNQFPSPVPCLESQRP